MNDFFSPYALLFIQPYKDIYWKDIIKKLIKISNKKIMKNIHLFETKNAYDAAKSGLILPTVSYVKDKQDVKYNPVFDANGHDFVEIAGIKWATMNVGASGITDYGLYFQWGDTKGYTADQVTGNTKEKAFNSSDYNTNLSTKYNKMGMTLELVDDAAHVYMKGSWRMPTKEEFDKLSKAVTTGWTDSYNGSGVAGMILTPTATTDTSKTLFFPACGNADDGSMNYVGSYGSYWSSSLGSRSVRFAYNLSFGNGGVNWQHSSGNRRYGFTVRGVLAEN